MNRSELLSDDAMVRRAIRARLAVAHAGEDAVIVDELKVARGGSRMDVTVINGRIEGYEIKSDKDTLTRLSRQAEMFGRVADRMTLVVGDRLRDEAKLIVPDWWSILSASIGKDGQPSLEVVRRGRLNKSQDKKALVETLERDEVLSLLYAHRLDKGFRSADYATLVARATQSLSHVDIGAGAKRMLKSRARHGAVYQQSAFGRTAIICSTPSSSDAGSPEPLSKVPAV